MSRFGNGNSGKDNNGLNGDDEFSDDIHPWQKYELDQQLGGVLDGLSDWRHPFTYMSSVELELTRNMILATDPDTGKPLAHAPTVEELRAEMNKRHPGREWEFHPGPDPQSPN